MRLLDLYCGAGGAGMGYYQAGWDVIGVDLEPQPSYPFMFVQDDAIRFLLRNWTMFDAVHASPPCQWHSTVGKQARITDRAKRVHVDMVPITRATLEQVGLPYVIENVVGAPLVDPVMLCGTMFEGLGVKRHRLFESNVQITAPAACDHSEERNPPRYKTLRHGKWYMSRFCPVYGDGGGKGAAGITDWGPAMGIDWMRNRREMAQSIPPAFTRHIGRQLEAAA